MTYLHIFFVCRVKSFNDNIPMNARGSGYLHRIY